jgi:hypothetical protein
MKIRAPILLFGMPRSGTTWLGKIFDSHPDTLYRHEPDTWLPIGQVPLLVPAADYARYQGVVREYLDGVPSMRADRVVGKQPIFAKRYASAGRIQLYKLGITLSKIGGRFGRELPVGFAPRGQPSARLVWKSIESLGRWGLFMSSIPDTCGVQIIRHPCGYVNSVLRGEADRRFTHGEAAQDVGIFRMLSETGQARRRGLTLDDLMGMHPSERLAWRWVLFNEKAAEETAGETRCMRLYYEELCADPAGVTRRLFDHCGLDWNEQTEKFLSSSTSQARADYYSVFKNPRESAWRWRERLLPEDIERVMRVVSSSEIGRIFVDSRQAWLRG